MSYSFDALRMFRFAVAIGAALTLAACSSDKTDADGLNGGAGGAFGAGGAGTPGSAQDFVVNVGDRVFFETDSSDLTSSGTATLDKQAQWLNQYSRYSITIEGHADERGTREYNFALGARRAQTVRDYLASKGVSSSRLKTTSFGKERPVAVCDDISCWSQNRRGVTVLGGQ
jgi:peptidoglycan-associated lipoprotein